MINIQNIEIIPTNELEFEKKIQNKNCPPKNKKLEQDSTEESGQNTRQSCSKSLVSGKLIN